jgi:type II secretory pathway pseudopilin PulG
MKTNKQNWFSLVELIIVITILAILWTISFIALQGYSANARDAKRISDIRSLYSKVTYEITKWVNIQELMTWTTQTGITINWQPQISNIWTINFDKIKEQQSSFQDPTTNEDYLFAYSVWTIKGTNWVENRYEFTQFATISEVENTSVIIWNYYKYKPTDSPSLFKIWNWIYLINGKDKNWIIYEIEETQEPSQPTSCPSWEYLVWTACTNVSDWWYSPVWDTNQYQCTWHSEPNTEKTACVCTDWYTWNNCVTPPTPTSCPAWEYLNWSACTNVTDWYYSPAGDTNQYQCTWHSEPNTEKTACVCTDWYNWNNCEIPPVVTATNSCTATWQILAATSIFTNSGWIEYNAWVQCDTNDIIICTWNWVWITLAACNVWARYAWAHTDCTTFASCPTDNVWLYYQWWINTWYKNENQDEISIITINWNVNETWTDRAWSEPCPSWYHIPTPQEWTDVVEAWWYNNTQWTLWAFNENSNHYNLWYRSRSSQMDNFRNKLKLPAAGRRYSSYLNNAGSSGFYWSSLAHASITSSARYLTFSSGVVYPGGGGNRHNGFPLRCFKN